MTTLLGLLALVALGLGGGAGWAWLAERDRRRELAARREAALAAARDLGPVRCVACGHVGAPVVLTTPEEARVACGKCLAVALEAVGGPPNEHVEIVQR